MSQHKPAEALRRFMHGIFDFYQDKRMPVQAAKGRMYDETLNAAYDMMKVDKDIPDHALVISAQFQSRLLNARGAELSKQLKTAIEAGDEEMINMLRFTLGQLKALKTSVDEFISTYKGVS